MFYTFGKFWSPFYPEKTKKAGKNSKFSKKYILRAIKYHKYQDPEKIQNPCKMHKKKNNFWAQNGYKLPPGTESNGQQKFSQSL